MIWPSDHLEGLHKFLVDRCAASIHFGLKIVWTLQAEAAYCSGVKHERVVRLLESCEMAIVNSKIDSTSFQSLVEKATHSRQSSLGLEAKETIEELLVEGPSHHNHHHRDQNNNGSAPSIKGGNDASNKGGSSASTSSLPASLPSSSENGQAANQSLNDESKQSTTKSNHDDEQHAVVSPSPMRDLSAVRQSLHSLSLERNPTDHYASDGEDNKAISNSSSPSGCPHTPPASSGLESDVMFKIFIAKQIRSEYFNSELGLITALEHLSAALVSTPRSARSTYIGDFITTLDETIARG